MTDPAAETATPAQLSDVQARPLSVSVRSVDIKYRVYQDRQYSARDVFSNRFRGNRSTIVHAVQNVSFDVRVGEAVGIVGSNGSGKSTLLRAVAGLQGLDSGVIKIRGAARLLGVSGALDAKLSGYRNVYLGGLAMGLPVKEIEDALPKVVEFSGIGEAMGRPMNTYSSGMRARLAFSIATLRTPDVLLIDEALAVGDKEFRARSLQRIREIRDKASAVIMVTHNMSEIRESCTRALWLEKGVLVADGSVDDVLGQYETRSA